MSLAIRKKQGQTKKEDPLVMETKLKIIEILQVILSMFKKKLLQLKFVFLLVYYEYEAGLPHQLPPIHLPSGV